MCRAEFYRDVLTFKVADLVQSFAKCPQEICARVRRACVQIANHRHCGVWLLRLCRERPRRGAAEQGNELPASDHSITSSARPGSGSGNVIPSALAVLRLST